MPHNFGGFGLISIHEPYALQVEIILPHWFIVLLFASLPMVWWFRRSKKCEQFRVCETCGYDLRATLERCPECGTMPSDREQGTQ
jgi:hypothetical protein